MIGIDPAKEDAYTWACLHTLRDFTGDGLVDIAIWCRERDRATKANTDDIALYTTQGGRLTRLAPSGSLLQSIRKALCAKAPGSPLCSGRR